MFDIEKVLSKIDKKEYEASGSDREKSLIHDDVMLESQIKEEPIAIDLKEDSDHSIDDYCYSDFYEKHSIQNMLSKEELEIYYSSKGRIIRCYVTILAMVITLNFYINMTRSSDKRDELIEMPIATSIKLVMMIMMWVEIGLNLTLFKGIKYAIHRFSKLFFNKL